ncbi:MAG: flagellin lysine-N-methylase [Terracidiphilus sp.]
MRQTRLVRPEYAEHFSCIGSACEDTCCAGWTVTVDEASYRKYTSLPHGPLRSLVDPSLLFASDAVKKKNPGYFAAFRMLPSGFCPFLSEERLCRIQMELGESYLCRTCAAYPRFEQTIDGLKETELSLSCPEAARLVLLNPSLLPSATGPGYQMTWDEAVPDQSFRLYFWPIRTMVLGLIQNREYALWQRMFLLGTFSSRLEALVRGELKRSVPDLLSDFVRAISTRGLCVAMEKIPANLSLQLEIMFRLIAQRVSKNPISSRMHQVLSAFCEGVGHSRTASMETQAGRYADAYTQFFSPFFSRHPYILENYLLNAVLRKRFPFRSTPSSPQGELEPASAIAEIVLEFALIKGLLIGVAGARGRKFNSADVVKTVQTVSKHFEHNRQFLSEAHATLAERDLNNTYGLTMLLRN